MSVKDVLSKFLKKKESQSDSIQVTLNGLYIKMQRITSPEIPHEVTVVVPRAEIRERYDENGHLLEKEVILSSITVVHAPRHPLAGPPSPPPEIPARYQSSNFKRKEQ
ncbi:hypothetical protein [Clostridium formicaceticum]|uniref:Uncharacterized protein n=1 Tax=Clostridium formicaceticum TaxID=1497 RepID=A0AAC9RMR8_9CLOT|nr:hypothetical protein [Clostridium formicaceticum]AOY77932.1 hypothetical protein BJL90_19945 [Clostridium formicaceticum]ARE88554.1 hypothetical protein CLFO_29600 [Clostridium formicaceticum]